MSSKLPEQENPDHRRERRQKLYAKAMLMGYPGYVRNLSGLGMAVEFMQPPAIQTGEETLIDLIPEEETGLEAIHGRVVLRWIEDDPPFHTLGLELLKPDDEARQRVDALIDYFSNR